MPHRVSIAFSVLALLTVTPPPYGSVAALALTLPMRREVVHHDLHALPGERLSETIVTKTPQSIDVTMVRVSVRDAAMLARPYQGATSEALAPDATLIEHFISKPPTDGQSPLKHRIELDPLPAGLYQIRLTSPERTAFQDLNVGTIGVMINRGIKGNVLMAIDVRSLRRRSDVAVLEFTDSGVHRYSPSADGVLRLPSHFLPLSSARSGYRGIIVAASDNSVVALPAVSEETEVGLAMYFDTDRKFYRPGDRIKYRFFSRDPESSTFAGVVGGSFWYDPPILTIQHVTTGSFALPADAAPGFWRNGGFSIASMRSRYELEAATLTPVVSPGGTARFVLSGTLLDGSPAAGVSVRYGWHGTHEPEFVPLQDRAYGTNGSSPGDLTYESVTLDSQGNALLEAPADSLDVELYVFDPDTQELTTLRVPRNAAEHGSR